MVYNFFIKNFVILIKIILSIFCCIKMKSYKKSIKKTHDNRLIQPETTIAKEIKEAMYENIGQEVSFYSEDAIKTNGSTFTFKYPEFWKTVSNENLAIGIRGIYFNKSHRTIKFMFLLQLVLKFETEEIIFNYEAPINFEITNQSTINDFINHTNTQIDKYFNRKKVCYSIQSFYKPDVGHNERGYICSFQNNPKFTLEENSIGNLDKYNIKIKFDRDDINNFHSAKIKFVYCNYYAINFLNIPDSDIIVEEYGYRDSKFYPINNIRIPVNAYLDLDYLVSASFVNDDIHKHLGKTNTNFEPQKIYPIISGINTFDLTFYTLDGLQYVEIPNCDSSFFIEAVLLRRQKQQFII